MSKKVLIIDNYDSFVYNLIDEFKLLDCDVKTFRNDTDYKALCDTIKQENPELIVLSPGPGHPKDAGNCIQLLKDFSDTIPFLGICLGHQAMGVAFGGEVTVASEILHGKASAVSHNGDTYFKNLDNPFRVGRYHSLVVSTLPEDMVVMAEYGDLVMAMRHKSRPVFGIQFHPESFLTPQGPTLIQAFLEYLDVIKAEKAESVDVSKVLNALLSPEGAEPENFRFCFKQLMTGKLLPAQAAAFLTALRAKGESAAEIAMAAEELRDQAMTFDLNVNHLADNCGTGGDGTHTFNISTTAAFVAAGAGVHMAKHGNRSVSSKSGSADVLEKLGVRIDFSIKEVKKAITECGLGFLFARQYHPAMKHVGPIRQALGMRTIFNILGPLLNPAQVKRQVIGVFAPDLVPTMAEALLALGHEQALVVHGSGLDEFALHGVNTVAEVKDGKIFCYEVKAGDFGLSEAPLDDIRGGGPEDNAELSEKILKGEVSGACRDITVLNAGATIYVAGLTSTFEDGVTKAQESIDAGKAYHVLEKLRALSLKAGEFHA